MLIASSLAVASALLASAALTTRPLVTTPPLVVGVTVVSDISAAQVTRVLQEAADIWHAAGVDIVWQRHNVTVAAKPSVRVTIGNWRGAGMSEDKSMPLGWIVFTDGAPEHEIYVSYTNAVVLLDESRANISPSNQMPRAERDTMLGRAMGRAMAHELGHFLLASTAHSARGLMRAKRTATEFFSTDRSRFAVEPRERASVTARLLPPIVLASRPPFVAGEAAIGEIR
jgi:hypothetical protein